MNEQTGLINGLQWDELVVSVSCACSEISMLCLPWHFKFGDLFSPSAVLSRCHLVCDKPLFTTYSAVIFTTVNLLDYNAAISLCLRSWEEDTANSFPFLKYLVCSGDSSLQFHVKLKCRCNCDKEPHDILFCNMCEIILYLLGVAGLIWYNLLWAAIRVCLLFYVFSIGPTEPVFVCWWSLNGLHEFVTFLQCRQQNPCLPGSQKLSWTQSRPKQRRTTFAMQYCQPCCFNSGSSLVGL